MSEAPRVSDRMPNFWWCPTHHLYRGGDNRPCADAVKLGDVEALKVQLIEGISRIENEIHDESRMDEYKGSDWYHGGAEALRRIRDLAEGETR